VALEDSRLLTLLVDCAAGVGECEWWGAVEAECDFCLVTCCFVLVSDEDREGEGEAKRTLGNSLNDCLSFAEPH